MAQKEVMLNPARVSQSGGLPAADNLPSRSKTHLIMGHLRCVGEKRDADPMPSTSLGGAKHLLYMEANGRW